MIPAWLQESRFNVGSYSGMLSRGNSSILYNSRWYNDLIQPLDRFGFLQWKSYAKKFSEHVRIYCPNINVFKRNNILKLQALIHNQFSSPRYVTMWQYSFYLAGYLATKPSFVNPIDFAFGDVTGTCNEYDCYSFIFVRCLWCKLKICFHHFFDDTDDTSNSKPHLCNIFVP